MAQSVSFRAEINGYTNKVLGVVKEKFGLRDKAEALNKFAEMYGEEFVEPELNENVLRELIKSCEEHIKKYGYRKMSIKELDKLCGIENV